MNNRPIYFGAGALGGLNGFIEGLRIVFKPENIYQFLASYQAIRLSAGESGEQAARSNHRIEQPAGGLAIPEVEPIGHNSANSQMLGQWAHDVLQSLTNQHDVIAGRYRLVQQLHAALLQARLQKIFEKLFAQQVQAIAAHSPQHGM